jgi:NitT/TauT family transport system substrate-binding protein
MVASACASSGGGDPAASKKALTDVTLAFPLYGPGDVPFFLAHEKGYNKAEGINVHFTVVTSSVALQAASAGSVQFVYTTTIRPVKTLASGERFYAFMPVNVGFTDDVIMSKSAYQAAGLTSSSTLKQKMQALAGKPLGIISAGGENAEVWEYLFRLAGLPGSAVKTVALGSPDANLAALKRGSIVATNLGGTGPGSAVAAGYAKYLVRLSEGQVPAMNDVVSDVLVASTSYYKQHSDVVNAFIAAYKKAVADMYADPAAAADLVYQNYPRYFSDEPKDQYLAEYNLLISQKQLDPEQTISASQMNTLGKFLAATGQSIPANWRDVFEKP